VCSSCLLRPAYCVLVVASNRQYWRIRDHHVSNFHLNIRFISISFL